MQLTNLEESDAYVNGEKILVALDPIISGWERTIMQITNCESVPKRHETKSTNIEKLHT